MFRNYYSMLCAYAFRFLHEKETCEDIVQETYVKFWSSRDQICIDTSVKAYLFKAIRNACLNHIKHLNISNTYKQLNQDEIEQAELTEVDSLTSGELETQIRSKIDKMPPERRKIFILSRFEELKYKEIAEQLNISTKTVENQMGKALAYLRKELSDFLPIIILIIYYLTNRG